jgi:hypothetical protein
LAKKIEFIIVLRERDSHTMPHREVVKKNRRGLGHGSAVEHLLNEHKVLSSNPSTKKKGIGGESRFLGKEWVNQDKQA